MLFTLPDKLIDSFVDLFSIAAHGGPKEQATV